MISRHLAIVVAAILLFSPIDIAGQIYSRSITGSNQIEHDVTYLTLGAWEGKLDVYSRKDASGPLPTVVYFHSGGALGSAGRKDVVTLDLLPYLEWGWNVVNVEYNLPGLTLAPIAVQNALCAVRWVFANSGKYGSILLEW